MKKQHSKFGNFLIILSALSFLMVTIIAQSNSAMAQEVPSYWPYQGFLFDASGQPLNASVSLNVSVYEQSNSAVALWQGNVSPVEVRSGTFSVDLGEVGGAQLLQLINEGRARYIGVAVNDDLELTPRTRIGALPYATLASNAIQFNGRSVNEFVDQAALQTLSDRVDTIGETATAVEEAGTANQAVASNAQEAAEGAATAAANAQEAAEGAATAAANAQETANGAATAAANAQETANGAATTAASNSEDIITLQTDLETTNEDLAAVRTLAEAALTEAAIRALIESYNYLNQAAITNLVSNLINEGNYVTADEVTTIVNNIINNLNLATAASVDELNTTLSSQIDDVNQNLSTRIDTVETNLQNEVQSLRNEITTLRTELEATIDAAAQAAATNTATINTLQTTVNNLETTVNNFQGQAAEAFILGVSTNTTNGWVRAGDKQGIEAATEMCVLSYPNDPTAHYCSMDEVHKALSLGNYNNNINNVATWLFTTSQIAGDNNFCKNLLYPSGHLSATGKTLTIQLNQSVTDGGNGIGMFYTNSVGCGQSRKILCCR